MSVPTVQKVAKVATNNFQNFVVAVMRYKFDVTLPERNQDVLFGYSQVKVARIHNAWNQGLRVDLMSAEGLLFDARTFANQLPFFLAVRLLDESNDAFQEDTVHSDLV